MVILSLNTIDSSEAYKQIPICRAVNKQRSDEKREKSFLKTKYMKVIKKIQ